MNSKKQSPTEEEIIEMYGHPIENNGAEPVIYPKPSKEDLDLLKQYEQHEKERFYLRGEKVSRLKKNAAELLNEEQASKSFSENLGECIQGIDELSDTITQARMSLQMIENDNYLKLPEELDRYLSSLYDKLEDSCEKIEHFKKGLESGEIKFTNNH